MWRAARRRHLLTISRLCPSDSLTHPLTPSHPLSPPLASHPLLSRQGSGAFASCIEEAHTMVDDAWKAVDRLVPDSFAKVCLRAFGWFVCKVRDY